MHFGGLTTLGAATAEAKRLETSDAGGKNLIGDRRTLTSEGKRLPQLQRRRRTGFRHVMERLTHIGSQSSLSFRQVDAFDSRNDISAKGVTFRNGEC